jgi:hypothetical protein
MTIKFFSLKTKPQRLICGSLGDLHRSINSPPVNRPTPKIKIEIIAEHFFAALV